MSGAAPVRTTLVVGASAGAREAALAAVLAAANERANERVEGRVDGLADEFNEPAVAIIVEGLPDGRSALPAAGDGLRIVRIAPGCLCCTGNLILRVTLNRLLREPPAQLYLSIASATHLDQLRSWLSQPPYDTLLALSAELTAAPAVQV
jgi:hypothetical protein